MNPNRISPDDPRLTAYALNEMAPADRAEFEQALAEDATARQAVAEISATASALTGALEQEPLFAEASNFTEATTDKMADKSQGKPMEPVAKPAAKPGPYAKVVRFPYWTVSSLAAACFAVFFIYWQRTAVMSDQKHYIEVALPASAGTKNERAANKHAEADLAKVAQVELRQKSEQKQNESQLTMALPVAPAAAVSEEEKLDLSPFVQESADGKGYVAKNTLAGMRLRQLKDVASDISIKTNQYLSDAGASNTQESLRYTAGTVVGGIKADEHNTEAYDFRRDNDYLQVAANPLSTFSVDVDTASYANVRRFLMQGQRPPVDAVRIEELVNYFPYNYQPPASNVPFAAHLEVAGAPWAPAHRLVRIGLKGPELNEAARPVANLVFLLDVSGSMNQPNKLPLVKQSLRLLVEKLRPNDRVAIAVYAGASGLALPSTPAAHKAEILDAIDRLQAEGSTNGAMGIQLAYDIAKANFITGGVNRVILATDGDFNVGVTSEGELVRLVEEKAKSGVFLTVLGYGIGNLKDSQLEQLADKGNGNYAYIDSLAEAKKTLVEQAGGTLVTIAKDVKIQVEFNPALVQAYRLIGYENRLLAKEDFNNDQVDAGEIGAGHTVTALYEVVPVGVEMPAPGSVDALKYQKTEDRGLKTGNSPEILTVKIRYKEPAGEVSSRLEFPLRDAGARFEDASQDFKFAAAVAAFGMVLRDSPHKGASTLGDVVAWARAGLGSDAGGYRNEFIGLVERAVQVVQ